MFCSTIIPTIGRPSLARAVQSALAQNFAEGEHEVIVVNDSGRPLPAAGWQRSPQVELVHTQQRERSVARNTGAAVARGRYLHFLDDDDWLLTGGMRRLHKLAAASGAAWLHGGVQLMDRQGTPTIQLHQRLTGNCFTQTIAGEWIALQASLVDADLFHRIGGFNPRLAGPEDIDLIRRLALVTDIAVTPELIACVSMGSGGSTTNYGRHAAASRLAREAILDMDGVFGRLRASATGPFWHGRLARAYLTSVAWNLGHGRPLRASSRLTFGLAGLGLAGRHLRRPSFWRALSAPYQSHTFRRGAAEIQQVGQLTPARSQ
ncbi:MAG: glycosyltransferase family 2 protein [Candidatus Promineifilaceae bacterium]